MAYKVLMFRSLPFIILFFPLVINAQLSEDEIQLLQKLDSMQKAPVIAKHFASIYFQTTVEAVIFFEKDSQGGEIFISRLEKKFADYFFNAAEAFEKKETIPAAWQAYYRDTGLSTFQYRLLGINAHINGDIWQALTAEFTIEELEKYKRIYFRFNRGLAKQYRAFYENSVATDKKAGLINHLSFGIAKIYGKSMLFRWRKRQMKLAIDYFTDRARFDKNLSRLEKKMYYINQLVLHNL